jgi:hypothetical protein
VLTEEGDENQDHGTDSTHFDLGLLEELCETSDCMRFELELKLDDNRLGREGVENYIEEGGRWSGRIQRTRPGTKINARSLSGDVYRVRGPL